jgi:hypothetical protein
VKNAYILIEKVKGQRKFRRPNNREGNTQINMVKKSDKSADWTEVVRNRRQLQALVNKVMNAVVRSFLDGLSNCQCTSAVLYLRSIINPLERASITFVCRNSCQPSRRKCLSWVSTLLNIALIVFTDESVMLFRMFCGFL